MHFGTSASAARKALAALALLALVGACAPAVERPGKGSRELSPAPWWLLEVDGHGVWREQGGDPEGEPTHDVVFAWVDARVANLRYTKRVLVEVFAPYSDGVDMRVLLPASYRATLADGRERWGTDAIEIYPEGGPDGRALAAPVLFRLRLQHDLDADGEDEMVATEWNVLFGEGEALPPVVDPWARVTSPAQPASASALPEVYFPPFDDAGAAVIAEIERITDAQRVEPTQRRTIHAAVFNINDPGIVEALVAAHLAGVEVRLIVDGRKFRPWYEWHRGDDRLLAAGVPVLGVKREDSGAMHDKIALFDGRRVATGSFNWEWGARYENHENMVLTGNPDLVAAYAERFEALAGGVLRARGRAADPSGQVSVSFAPDEEPHRILGDLIDRARQSVYLAMFTCKDVVYRENGTDTSLFAKLAAARQRGVQVVAVVDYGVHEASEYHGIESPDDPSDEWLESRGIRVVRADNTRGPYASMHHKFVVVDEEIAITGAFNWYHDAAYRNDEDQLIWREPEVALRFRGELVDLLRRYDPEFSAADWPEATIAIDAFHDGTAWGDSIRLVGELDAAGAWDPARGVELDAATWPHWRGALALPQGVRMEYKLVRVSGQGGVHWEPGPNRLLQAPSGSDAASLEIGFRRY